MRLWLGPTRDTVRRRDPPCQHIPDCGRRKSSADPHCAQKMSISDFIHLTSVRLAQGSNKLLALLCASLSPVWRLHGLCYVQSDLTLPWPVVVRGSIPISIRLISGTAIHPSRPSSDMQSGGRFGYEFYLVGVASNGIQGGEAGDFICP